MYIHILSVKRVRGLYGDCMGTVRGLYGDCTGTEFGEHLSFWCSRAWGIEYSVSLAMVSTMSLVRWQPGSCGPPTESSGKSRPPLVQRHGASLGEEEEEEEEEEEGKEDEE